MRKITVILFVILIGGTNLFAQTSRAKKTTNAGSKSARKIIPKPQLVVLQREKFDPSRNSESDLQTAIGKAQKENKRIILDIGGEWCSWCVKMDNYFLENKALAKMRDENFIWVKVNMSEENENKTFLSKYPPPAGYPHLYVLETDGSLLFSQDTSQLEEQNLPIIINSGARGEAEKKAKNRSYDIFKFAEFLKRWSS